MTNTPSDEAARKLIAAARHWAAYYRNADPGHRIGAESGLIFAVADYESASHQTGKMEGDWIEWNGGECPVDPEANVRLRYANTMEVEAHAKAVYWRNQKKGHQPWGPITHYRLIDELRRPWKPKGNPEQCVGGAALVTPSARSVETVTWGELERVLREFAGDGGGHRGKNMLREFADHLARREG